MRLLEGEIVTYQGVAYIVKGYQHPDGHVIAYPRYDIVTGKKILDISLGKATFAYWDCIKQFVPMLPIDKVFEYQARLPLGRESSTVISTMSALLDLDPSNIYLTGSSIFQDTYNDVDLVIYGSNEELVERLRSLIEKGVLRRAGEETLVKEYFSKHSDKLGLMDYLNLKKSTILHLEVNGIHVNLKLYRFKQGFQTCREMVFQVKNYSGPVSVKKSLTPHLTPSLYIVELKNVGTIFMETHREVYCELQEGEYLVKEGRIEVREKDLFLVPDKGVLRPL